ncbi:hypothetical protein evm_009857 [Chilo suppressalis]|nr:hypothetical protein evm_009857 [Chilo suppressalis]
MTGSGLATMGVILSEYEKDRIYVEYQHMVCVHDFFKRYKYSSPPLRHQIKLVFRRLQGIEHGNHRPIRERKKWRPDLYIIKPIITVIAPQLAIIFKKCIDDDEFMITNAAILGLVQKVVNEAAPISIGMPQGSILGLWAFPNLYQ